ncbi:MAG TPA: M56 family metallopeptidase [Thermoanaerobaculia bacterium]|nr:M56 family metallopeptidase [Thermoanaerobaculia bacterium]
MNFLLEVLGTAGDRFFQPLVSHLWTSTLFLLFVVVLAALLGRQLTAASRFALVLVGLLKFAVPIPALVSAWRFFGFGTPSLGAVGELPLGVLTGAFPAGAAPQTPSAPWFGIGVAVWAIVAVGLVASASLARHRLVRLALRTAMPPHPREAAALNRARRRLGVGRSVDLARAAFPEAPAVLRIFRPLIVLPADGCEELSDEELESLLSHECAHVRRHDNLLARLESLIGAAFWFHPVIWIARSMTAFDRERACDEMAAGTAGGRTTYVAALSKYCRQVIAPRLPGVSCMATARLKERMEHVMNYPAIEARSPSPTRVALLTSTALLAFSVLAGMMITTSAGASARGAADPYAVKVTATRGGDSIVVQGTVSENRTQKVIAAPRFTIGAGESARATTSARGLDIVFAARPVGERALSIDVTIERAGTLVQKNTLRVLPGEERSESAAGGYTGQPINLDLEDAQLRDVLGMFGRITGLEMEIDPAIGGTVSVHWHNVPWDQAFDSILEENGLTYRIEGSKIHVSKK